MTSSDVASHLFLVPSEITGAAGHGGGGGGCFSFEQKTFPQETELCGNNANEMPGARSPFCSALRASFSGQRWTPGPFLPVRPSLSQSRLSGRLHRHGRRHVHPQSRIQGPQGSGWRWPQGHRKAAGVDAGVRVCVCLAQDPRPGDTGRAARTPTTAPWLPAPPKPTCPSQCRTSAGSSPPRPPGYVCPLPGGPSARGSVWGRQSPGSLATRVHFYLAD